MSDVSEAWPIGQVQPPKDGPNAELWRVAETVNDPEIPVLSIADLGILRSTEVTEDGVAVIVITPTYSGCPAMDAIADDLRAAASKAGYERVEIRTVLSPAWTTDWMTDEGKKKLEAYGIAPPTGMRAVKGPVPLGLSVKCPRCGSLNTKQLSRFGSTSCKALYSCNECLEPFDYFKVI